MENKTFRITCPYCFERFNDNEVHFRMETSFKSREELNDEKLDPDLLAQMADSPEKKRLMYQTKMRSRFLVRKDEKYENFWKVFGGTTEILTKLDEDSNLDPWLRPVLDPGNPEDQNVLKEVNHNAVGKEKFLVRDDDGMVKSVYDFITGETSRRVCPYCHNPLPNFYGKHDVRFIAITGITSSGKTVYISQLIKELRKYCTYLKLTATPLSNHEMDFVKKNPVTVKEVLPQSTATGSLAQPLFYQLSRGDNRGNIITNTIVFQDIAGEAFLDPDYLTKYGEFVLNANGIILILDPKQLNLVGQEQEAAAEQSVDELPTVVLETIHKSFVGNSDKMCAIPIAVCVSKGDMFSDFIPMLKKDLEPVKTEDGGDYYPVFNSVDYNELEPVIKGMMPMEVRTSLENQYLDFNYFAFSATGVGVKKVENKNMKAADVKEEKIESDVKEEKLEVNATEEKNVKYVLVGPPNPKRIAEPVFWLFHEFGFIKSEVPTLLPKPRPIPPGAMVPTGKFTNPSWFARVFQGARPEPIMRPMTPEEKEAFKYEEPKKARRPM